MKKTVIVLAVLGVLLLAICVGVAGIAVVSIFGKPRVPSTLVLEADFTEPIVETVPEDPLAQLLGDDTTTLRDVVEALDRAAEDSRVKAFVARIGGGGMGLGHLQEIRDAVNRFRASGKPTFAYAETYGEFGPGNGGYYLASAFDEVFVQPSGDVGITGISYESPFVRGMLDKLGVEPRMSQRHEYKNAMNFYTERDFTEPHRRAMRELMESQFSQIVRGIAEGRSMKESEVRELFDRGPYLGSEALDAGLVDNLLYRDEVFEKVREVAGERTKFLYLKPYLERAGRPHRSGSTIALIHGYGQVVRGPSTYSPLDGSTAMGSDTVSSAFRAAVRDKRVRAIVFRVDSPGGSYVASDTIWRETIRAADAEKPVIVSMGNVAGSGGYFVAMDAEKIVAQPGTITGSIGVLGGKMLTEGFWDKLGVSWDEVHSSANALMWSPRHDYAPAGKARFEGALDRIYEDFTQKVHDGRGIELDRVLEIARGRIWTGETALEIGLVDELGGLETAIRLAREAAGIEDEEVRLKVFPRSRSPFEAFFDRRESSERVLLRSVGQLLGGLQPHVRTLRRLGVLGEPGPVSVPAWVAEP